MVGKLKKLSTTFIYSTNSDSVVKLDINCLQSELSQNSDCTGTSVFNIHISRPRSDKRVTPAA